MVAPSIDVEDSPVTGLRLGRYEVIRRLATGGMAELLLAKSSGVEGFEKLVVLKRILPHLRRNAEFVEMFLREAKLAATLEHPNIVHVSDIGLESGDFFFAMAFLEGKDLSDVLKVAHRLRKTVPLESVLHIIAGIAAGLHYAHEKGDRQGKPLGIVHRDVSPQNVFLTYEGGVKLLDFGIARAAAKTRVTRVGVRKGKAQYMSPEQCRDLRLDGRSDIFSLGILLYELTTMRPLFRGDNELAIMHRIVSETVPKPSSRVPDYPADLETIVMRALARDRKARYASALELQLALESYARDAGLVPSSSGVARLLHDMFGPPTPAWVELDRLDSSDMGGRAPVDESWSIPPSPAFGILGGSPSMDNSAARSRPRSGPQPRYPVEVDPTPDEPFDIVSTGTAFTGALVDGGEQPGAAGRTWGRWVALVALVVVAGLFGTAAFFWASRPAEAVGTVAAAVPPAPEVVAADRDESELAAPAMSPADGERLLFLVNQHDPQHALGFEERRQVLDQLRGDARFAGRIDLDAEAKMDLLQAPQSPTPCRTFAEALDRVARNPADFEEVLREVAAPATHGQDRSACEGLDARLRRIAAAASPPVATASRARTRSRRAKRSAPTRAPKPPPPSPAEDPPEPVAEPVPQPPRPQKLEKLRDGELRPLR